MRQNLLIEECKKRSIEAPDNSYKDELLSLLLKHSLSISSPSHGMQMRASIESPMLCFSFNDLSSIERDNVLRSERWIAEPKLYGCRVIICYYPTEGFTFFSRSISDTTFLPIEYTGKILLNDHGILRRPDYWIGAFDEPFILDGEAYSDKGLRRKGETEPYLGYEKNYMSLMMSLEQEETFSLQISRLPINVSVFDILLKGSESTTSFPLYERKKILSQLSSSICFFPLEVIRYNAEDKLYYIKNLMDLGYEGSVLKNLDMPYLATSRNRDRSTQVRIKRRDFDGLNDLDVYIVGVSPYHSDCFQVAVRLIAGEVEEEIIIGDIKIPDYLISSFFSSLESGLMIPKAWIFGKVMTVRVKGFDPLKIKFSSIMPDWKEGFREDKTRFDCTIEYDFLDSIMKRRLR